MWFGKYFLQKFLIIKETKSCMQKTFLWNFGFAIAKVVYICHNKTKEVRHVFGGKSSAVSSRNKRKILL